MGACGKGGDPQVVALNSRQQSFSSLSSEGGFQYAVHASLHSRQHALVQGMDSLT